MNTPKRRGRPAKVKVEPVLEEVVEPVVLEPEPIVEPESVEEPVPVADAVPEPDAKTAIAQMKVLSLCHNPRFVKGQLVVNGHISRCNPLLLIEVPARRRDKVLGKTINVAIIQTKGETTYSYHD